MTDLYAKTAQQMLDPATITSLSSVPVRKLAERIAIAVAGDEQLGGGCDLSAGMFGTRLSALVVELAGQEAELYAAQDQITGLQELMRTQCSPDLLATAVRHLVAHANSQSDNAPSGSPEHGHSIPGRWNGDSVNPKGALCEECRAWDILRQYAATGITAESQVTEDARVTQLLAILAKFVEHHDTHQLELTEDQKVDQDLLWFEAVAEARAAITQPAAVEDVQ